MIVGSFANALKSDEPVTWLFIGGQFVMHILAVRLFPFSKLLPVQAWFLGS